MQTELRETYPQLRISLLGINEEGHEFGSDVLAEKGDIPWLQDVDADNNDVSDVWYDLWQITFRDVLILDGDNSPVASFNLTQANLGEPESYASLRDLLLDSAMKHQKPFQNSANPMDIDNGGSVIPLDVLIIVNEINLAGSYSIPPLQGPTPPTRFYDSNGDGDVTPLDALVVVNHLNDQSAATNGEGEAPSQPLMAITVNEISDAVDEAPGGARELIDRGPETSSIIRPAGVALSRALWQHDVFEQSRGETTPTDVDRVFAEFAAKPRDEWSELRPRTALPADEALPLDEWLAAAWRTAPGSA